MTRVYDERTQQRVLLCLIADLAASSMDVPGWWLEAQEEGYYNSACH